MSTDLGRVRAVLRKETREYRRNRFVLYTMVVLPLIFVAVPIIDLFNVSAQTPANVVNAFVGLTMVVLLLVPVILPATISAYSVIGERDQGTLEPLLTTPITREELLLGKALAAALPAVAIAYVIFAAVFIAVRIGAVHDVVSAVWQPTQFVSEALFAPLLATWSVWVGMAISARSTDVRAAQQLGTLASLPALALIALMAFQVVPRTVTVAVIVAAVLVVVDVLAWRVVSAMFDRERLLTGVKPSVRSPAA